MKRLVIAHHLGLGDHIMLNGMVRHFIEIYDEVYLFIRKVHEESVKFMYRDVEHQVKLLLLGDPIPPRWQTMLPDDADIMGLATYGFEKRETWNNYTNVFNWAHIIYLQAKVNPYYMYSKFKVVRAKSHELTPPKGEYIFIHDKSKEEFKSDEKSYIVRKCKENSTIAKYAPGVTEEIESNIFKYISIIENAKEVYCTNSSWAWLIELMNIGDSSKNYLDIDANHTYYDKHTTKTVFRDTIWTYVTNETSLQ